MIPNLKFPTSLDDDSNLYSVKDSLRLTLATDYNVGDTSVIVENNQDIMALFPDSGIITLVENCSEPHKRAISFYYTSRTTTTFDGLSILEGFVDVYKPKNVTNVLQNIMAEHHNSIKNSLFLIENYIGLKGEMGTIPLKGNLEERTNYLQSVAYSPKAWFICDKTIGVVPFTVSFTDQSFRLGKILNNNDITFIWDFGDNAASIINYVQLSNDGNVKHTYYKPGIYDVTLTVKNKFGTDSVKLPALINSKYEAPDFAVIEFALNNFQIYLNNKIKTPTGVDLAIFVPQGINPATGRTYAGEEVDANNNAIDPITSYTWLLSDDLSHTNTLSTTAMYSNGGVYDVVLRVDTYSKAYRYTIKNNYINVVEPQNLWLFTFNSGSSNILKVSEFGFLSQTFKTRQSTELVISANTNFLIGTNNSTQAIREFKRNTFFTQASSQTSGFSGVANIYYASGRNASQPATSENINTVEFNGYTETYADIIEFSRPWNWIAFNVDFQTYFLFGNPDVVTQGLSLTNQFVTIHSILSNTVSTTFLTPSNYISAATDLQQNPSSFDDCNCLYGYFSVYRTAWRERNGYFVRNSGVGSFFQLNDFYRTEENGGDPIYYFRKLATMAGPPKTEGQLVNLTSGLYFFNNTGSVSAYDPNTETWQVGGPGLNSVTFRNFQDTTNKNYNDSANTLLATSDGSHNAYLSFDYSSKSFLQFSDIDLSFQKLDERPNLNQWSIGTF